MGVSNSSSSSSSSNNLSLLQPWSLYGACSREISFTGHILSWSTAWIMKEQMSLNLYQLSNCSIHSHQHRWKNPQIEKFKYNSDIIIHEQKNLHCARINSLEKYINCKTINIWTLCGYRISRRDSVDLLRCSCMPSYEWTTVPSDIATTHNKFIAAVTNTTTLHPFNGLLSRTTWVSR